jgi:hypothetical protein
MFQLPSYAKLCSFIEKKKWACRICTRKFYEGGPTFYTNKASLIFCGAYDLEYVEHQKFTKKIKGKIYVFAGLACKISSTQARKE